VVKKVTSCVNARNRTREILTGIEETLNLPLKVEVDLEEDLASLTTLEDLAVVLAVENPEAVAVVSAVDLEVVLVATREMMVTGLQEEVDSEDVEGDAEGDVVDASLTDAVVMIEVKSQECLLSRTRRKHQSMWTLKLRKMQSCQQGKTKKMLKLKLKH